MLCSALVDMVLVLLSPSNFFLFFFFEREQARQTDEESKVSCWVNIKVSQVLWCFISTAFARGGVCAMSLALTRKKKKVGGFNCVKSCTA